MNESTLTQLKIFVERAVRPMRATLGRKRRMREELLAHVTTVFEEEAQRHDESAALERTRQRFGEPEELTRQLQASVPTSDAPFFWVEAFVGCPSHESVLRRAARYALVLGVFAGFCMILLTMAMKASRWEYATLARLPSLLAPVWMAGLIFIATLLEHAMRQALFSPGGRSWIRAFAIGVATWLLVPGLTLAWSIAVTGNLYLSVVDTGPVFVSGLLAPVALVLVVNVCISDIRYLEEWANLQIN